MREELTRVSRGLIETAHVRTSSSLGFRSGISTSWRTSSTSGPPNRGKTTALQVVAMLLIPRFVEAWRNLASAADLPETQSLLHTVILSIQGFLDALETLIPCTIQISVLRWWRRRLRRKRKEFEEGEWRGVCFWKEPMCMFSVHRCSLNPLHLAAGSGTAIAFTSKIRVQCTWHRKFWLKETAE